MSNVGRLSRHRRYARLVIEYSASTMALSELELKRCERDIAAFMSKRRPPAHIRPKLDYGYKLSGQSLELLEIRPLWQNEQVKSERPFSKITFVKSGQYWKLYWIRADMKWHSYAPHPVASTLAEALEVIDKDEHCCFFG
jgi:hypothetical protein